MSSVKFHSRAGEFSKRFPNGFRQTIKFIHLHIRSTKLNVHKREIHSTKGSHCELCRRDFTNLRNHMLVVHEKSRPFICDVDGKKFAKLHGLRRHIEAVHLNITPYACLLCEKKFKEASALRKHQEHVHTKVRVFRGFAKYPKSQQEISDWGEDEEIETNVIRYKCLSCSSSFSSELSVLQHRNKFHSTGLVCDMCSHCFDSKRKISRHIKLVHLKTPVPGVSITQKKVLSKVYKCGVCKTTLKNKRGLERHKRVVHRQIYDFMCDKCSAVFRDRGAFNKHHRKYHAESSISEKSSVFCSLCAKLCLSDHHLEKHETACRLKKQMILNYELDSAANNRVKKKEEIELIAVDVKEEVLEDFDPDASLKEETLEFFEEHLDDELEQDLLESEKLQSIRQSKVFEHIIKIERLESVKQETTDPFNEEIIGLEQSAGIHSSVEEGMSIIEHSETKALNAVKEKFSKRHVFPTHKMRDYLNCRKPTRTNLRAQNKSLGLIETSDGEPDDLSESELEQMFKGQTFNIFSRSFECKICSIEFEKHQDLKLHCVIEHRIKKIRCQLCNHSFSERKQVQTHFFLRHPTVQWDKSFNLRNYTIPNESVRCQVCSKMLSRKESLKRHMELVHSAERPSFYCDQCGEVFRDFRTLTFHISKHHAERADEKNIVRRRKTTKASSCEDCGEIVYGRKDQLSHRWKKHLNFKIFNKSRYHCLICGEVVRCSASAKRHHIQVHRRGKLLVRTCHDCSLSFQLFHDFKKHIDEKHESDNICLICGIKIESVAQMLIHEKSHRVVPESEKKYVCDLCGWRAQQKISVETHMVRYHGASKKQYQATCEFCGNSYNSYQSFHAHRQSHVRELNKIECRHCDKAYHNLRDLKNHEESHKQNKGNSQVLVSEFLVDLM